MTVHNTSNHHNYSCSLADCDVVVPAAYLGKTIEISTTRSNSIVDASKVTWSIAAVLPGQRVCIPAGDYESLKLDSIQGTAAQPIEVTNCGGQVHLTKATQGSIVTLASVHFKLLGNGHAGTLYGFMTDKVDDGTAVVFGGLSRDYEAAWISIKALANSFAGLFAKTDADDSKTKEQQPKDPVTGLDYVQTGTHLHHIRVNGSGDGEGFYVGHFSCAPEYEIEYRLRNVRIHDNIFFDTGAEGMQVGCAESDTKIYNNFISHAGWHNFAGTGDQAGGLQVGSGTAAELYGNWIEDVKGRCLHFAGGQSDAAMGQYQINFHDNTAKNCGSFVYLNQSLTQAKSGNIVRIADNVFENNNLGCKYVHSAGSLKSSSTKSFVPMEWTGNTFSGQAGSLNSFIYYDTTPTAYPASSMKDTVFTDNLFK